MSSEYVVLEKHPGIRKHVKSGRYQAKKKIGNKQYAETFDSLRDAIYWRNTFNGERKLTAPDEGEKKTSTLGHVWGKMQELHFPSLELSTQLIWKRRFEQLENLTDFHMEDITSKVINEWIEEKKKYYLSDKYEGLSRGRARRCNLYNELNLFTCIFNWYKSEDIFEEESAMLINPIRLRHKKMAFIRDTPVKPEDRKIPVGAAFKFFSAFNNELYADLAMAQFFCAGRISEIAGIQISNIYLEEEYILIKDVVVWANKNKMFEYLKPFPKNRETRRVHIHPWLRAIIERRLKARVPGCNYLFHVDGKPLNYCTIQVNYRGAQKRCGIPYRGTHCLRHGMATLARKVGGQGLDSVIAMTGHKDLKLADHYSKIDGEVQRDTSLKVLEYIRQLGLYESETEKYTNVIPLRSMK
ncbi:MAG TPA: site-specific integrase [Bdellovibrio sp.]|uniref:tyrosine-type recombinase/integrase n=1 Tax=Bdellovibrio sp. TaxID=28201 RepID=UPI002F1627B0